MLKSLITVYDKNILFLLLHARQWAFSHIAINDLAIRAAGFSRGLFLFGYLPDSRAKDLRLGLGARASSLRGWQGNDKDFNLFRPQKGRGSIRAGYTTQCLSFLKGRLSIKNRCAFF